MNEQMQNPVLDTKQRNKSRLMFILIAIIFLIPIIGPFFWTPKSFVNRGELIQPQARSMETIKLLNENAENVDIAAFQGKWTMLIVDHASCNEVCQNNLYNIRQVRFTQGRRMKRVQLAWILLSGEKTDIDQQFFSDYPQVQRYNIPSDQFQTFNDLFQTNHGSPADDIQRVYFIDPFGNLVMSFSPEQNPKDMQKDLGRLLRVSKAGENQS